MQDEIDQLKEKLLNSENTKIKIEVNQLKKRLEASEAYLASMGREKKACSQEVDRLNLELAEFNKKLEFRIEDYKAYLLGETLLEEDL